LVVAAPRTSWGSLLRAFASSFAAFSRRSRGLGSLGKESSKTTDQLRTVALARFQQLLAKALEMLNEHFLSGAKDSTCW
jgi:hypothetical protein